MNQQKRPFFYLLLRYCQGNSSLSRAEPRCIIEHNRMHALVRSVLCIRGASRVLFLTLTIRAPELRGLRTSAISYRRRSIILLATQPTFTYTANIVSASPRNSVRLRRWSILSTILGISLAGVVRDCRLISAIDLQLVTHLWTGLLDILRCGKRTRIGSPCFLPDKKLLHPL